MSFDHNTLLLFLQGLMMTLKLLSISLLIGLILAFVLALMRVSKAWWINGPAFFYTYVIRGTPVLVQLFLIYYGFAQFDLMRDSSLWTYFSDPVFCAWLAFIINTSAYSCEILTGAIKASSQGELEAAKAYGMNGLTLYRRIILPSAFRRALPAYSNEVIMMLHTTSLASVVTLADITGTARDIYSETFEPFAPFLTAATIYLVLTFILVQIFRWAEKRWLAYAMPQKI
jgi:His/Glu/Gln/Arg/opine family amino acid ABC transporter permease subunit